MILCTMVSVPHGADGGRPIRVSVLVTPDVRLSVLTHTLPTLCLKTSEVPDRTLTATTH